MSDIDFIGGNAALLRVVGLVMLFGGTPCIAQTVEAANQAMECQALGTTDFSAVQDAPTQILGAQLVQAGEGLPSYCQVRGYVTPNVNFELRLPAAHWNGKFMEAGCGGFCGSIVSDSCDHPLRQGYACLATDEGHQSTLIDAKWAYNNLQAEVDHAYRATHVTALAGKAITEQYFRQAPRRSYFMGCSGGGRQGMVEAQRFPWDFNGIIVGAPGLDLTGAFMNLLWGGVSNVDPAGKPILQPGRAAAARGGVGAVRRG